MTAPLRAVVRTERGPRSQRVKVPGGYAIVCGPAPTISYLECGHVVTTYDGRRKARRCSECAT